MILTIILTVAAATIADGGASGLAAALSGGQACPGLSGFTCSTLTVPLDRSGRVRGSLRLNVAAADNTGAARGVLLFLTGGPGQPGVPAVAKIVSRLSPVLGAYRLVMVDQRGTGATAIQCPLLQQQVGTSDIAVPTKAAVRACATTLGPSRAFYSTRDTVADLDTLRRALGVKTWTLDGVSYGTFVAERYAIAHATNVRALVLDSVVPHVDPQVDDALYVVGLQATGRVLRAACADLACGYDPAAEVAWVVRHGIAPVPLWDAIVTYEFVDPEYQRMLEAIHEARQGDPAPLRTLIDQIHAGSGAPPELFSSGLHAATLCADFRFPWQSTTPITKRPALLARRAAALPDRAFWPFTRATAEGNGIVETCLPWPVTPAVPQPAPRTRLPAVPVLLVNGDHDLSTPLEWAREEARLAPRGKLVVVHGASHSVQSREQGSAGRAAVDAFLLGAATA